MKYASALRIGIVAGFFILLELLARTGLVSQSSIVAPSQMVTSLVELMQQAEFWQQLAYTALCIVASLAASIAVGFAAGVLLHRVPRVRQAVEPLISSYYALPFLVLYPLFIVLFGMNALPIIFVGFIYGFMAMLTATLSGLDRIPAVFGRVGRTLQLDRVREAFLIQLPAASPYLMTGIKLALGYAITGVIGSEFILSNNGFGYAIAFSYNNFDDKTMYARLLFLIIVMTIITILLNAAEQKVMHRSGAAGKGEATSAFIWERATAGVIIVLVIVALWQLLHFKVGQDALASPMTAFLRLSELLSGQFGFWQNVSETAKALSMSLLISCVVGTFLGIVIGLSKLARAVFEPILVTLYALPKVTLYPVVLLFFGIGLTAKVAFGTLYGMIPMILITINAIVSMNPVFSRTARVMRLTPSQMFSTILVPATLPEICSGLRISFSITLLGVMIGEMFASRRGLGSMIMQSMGVNDTATMMAVTVFVGVFAVIVNRALMTLDTRLRAA